MTRLISSMSSFEGQQTRHSLLTNYYKQNTTTVFPAQAASLLLSPPLVPSLELETKKRIHHPPKRVRTIRRGASTSGSTFAWCLQPPQHGVCSPPSMGPALLTTASNRPCLFLTTLDHSGQRFNMHPVSLNTGRNIKQQTSFN